MAVRWMTKCGWDTGYSADSVEWCPVPAYSNVLVCGTYQLEDNDEPEKTKKQKRLGKIYLFVVNENTTELNPIQTIKTPGVLDQKWCYHTIEDHPILGVVTSAGTVQFYTLKDDDGKFHLEFWFEKVLGDSLALSLDWSTNKIASQEPSVVISDSAGSVTIFKLATGDLLRIGKYDAHGFEAWITAFNYWTPDVFYSGGDDGTMKSFDVRMPDIAVITNRSHDAGVTSIRSHVDDEYQLLTGSYDEKVRLWDTRNLKISMTEAEVGGGVWRLKWHPYTPDTVLAACMYGGFRTLRADHALAVTSEYLEHDSIAYGADWRFYHKLSMVATCSFYDCKMHISEIV